jgi:hypothetical protein
METRTSTVDDKTNTPTNTGRTNRANKINKDNKLDCRITINKEDIIKITEYKISKTKTKPKVTTKINVSNKVINKTDKKILTTDTPINKMITNSSKSIINIEDNMEIIMLGININISYNSMRLSSSLSKILKSRRLLPHHHHQNQSLNP